MDGSEVRSASLRKDSAFSFKTALQDVRQAALLLLIAGVPAFAAALATRPEWRAEALLPGETSLASALNASPAPLWIDARPAADYAREHIPGALSLNEDDWDALLPQVLEKWQQGQTLVVYCSSQSCEASADVAKRLRNFPLGRVEVLHGGWEAWKKK